MLRLLNIDITSHILLYFSLSNIQTRKISVADGWQAFRLISGSGEKSTGKLNNPPRSHNRSNTESTEIPTTTHCPPSPSSRTLSISDQSPAATSVRADSRSGRLMTTKLENRSIGREFLAARACRWHGLSSAVAWNLLNRFLIARHDAPSVLPARHITHRADFSALRSSPFPRLLFISQPFPFLPLLHHAPLSFLQYRVNDNYVRLSMSKWWFGEGGMKLFVAKRINIK